MQRIRIGVILMVVFLLVFATNRMDNNHFRTVQKSLNTVYEDRILAKDYLYKISHQVQKKKEDIQSYELDELSSFNKIINDSIQVLIHHFGQTELTENESLVFESLQTHIRSLNEYESKLLRNEFLNSDFNKTESERYFSAIFGDIDSLFKVQIEESNRVISNSNRTINTSNLISRVEIGALILIGLLMQLLIFLRPIM